MKLAAGTRLGPYAVERRLGSGGMGVVYRAEDPRLGRKVAIKLLPNAQGEYFRRFEREARTIGSLNHPNLLTLFDVGEHDGTPFLVTELLDGESLRTRLAHGPLKLRAAIRIAADVARGLAAAHEAGVIHRDVKPDNIFLTGDGRVKILDFGIAKLLHDTSDGESIDPALAPTPSPTTRDTGVVIGTPGYMAPEQLDGGTVDARTDIFAFGVVLYEMISGQRAFAAETPVEESYAILKTTPDPPKGATKALARVVMRCLEKRKDARFQSAVDLAFALDELDASTDPIARISKVALERDSQVTLRDPQPPVGPAAAPATPSTPAKWYVAAALAAIALVLGGMAIGRRLGGGAPSGTGTGTGTGSGSAAAGWPSLVPGGVTYRRVTYHTQSRWDARLAPDGASVLYSVPRGDGEVVVRSQLAQPTILSTNVPGRLLDVSARGELAVLQHAMPGKGGTLARAVENAGVRPVADRVTEAAWLPDGESFAIVRGELAIEAPIGHPIVRRTAGKLDLLRVAPDGARIAFADHPASGDSAGRVVIVDRAGVEVAASSAHTGIHGLAWSPDGREVWFSNDATIFALDAAGHERVVLRGPGRLILVDARAGKLLVAPSDLRLKLFTGARGGPYRDIGWFDGSEAEAMSADGGVIAFIEAIGTGQTADGYAQFLRRADQPATLIGHGGRFTLLPDASAVIAVASATSLQRIPTGVGTPSAIPLGTIARLDPSDRIAVSWSGRHVVVRGAEAGAPMRLWRIELAHPDPQPIAADHASGRHPISPDGDVVAVVRPAGGVLLAPVAGGAPTVLDGPVDEEPLGFTADGAALFVMHRADATIAVDRIDLATRTRRPWTRIAPEQRPAYFSVVLDATGDNLAYSTNADASDLYVLEP